MSLAIRAENLSKRYRLGEYGRRSFFRDWTNKLLRRPEPDDSPGSFWALRDISFDVLQGDVLGVLGHNGAGKSTLLKILSAITAPTKGCVSIKGRMASLLEVGTGFHMDLSGRDNVFLNGAVLGMSRREIQAKFDEIVAFSGVEQFIDTPVKRYSSGMRVRLAFAVAAHLEPEILIADEVLAVGDAAFQQRCLGQLGRVSQSGRTVLFVSHNAAAVSSLCKRGIVLDHGRLVFEGTQLEALAHYSRLQPTSGIRSVDGTRSGSGEIQVTSVELRSGSGEILNSVYAGQDLEVWMHFRRHVQGRWPGLCVRLHVASEHGDPLFAHFNDLSHTAMTDADGTVPESGTFVCRIPKLPLVPGLYSLESVISTSRRNGSVLDKISPALKLTVDRGDFFGTGELPNPRFGAALVSASWRREERE